jgi:membrane-associated HD superfamily phosphohydrolase
MGCLKSFLTFVLSFIFFIGLSVFSVAFMLHGTVLSYDFVSNQVDKVPISAIARDVTEDQIGKELPQEEEFLKEVAYNVIEEQEPWIKTQLKAAINTGYDYFLGRSDYLTITIPLSELKVNLKESLWQGTKDYLQQELTGKTDAEISSYLQDIIRQIPQDILPPDLLALSPGERNEYIEQYLRDFAGVAPKAGYPALDAHYKSLGDQYLNQYLDDFVNEIPNSFTIDESSIDSGTMHGLQQVRQYVDYFQTYYTWLIVALLVLVMLIFLVNMSIKAPARALGIDLLIFGIIDLVGIILLRTLPITQWVSERVTISPALNTWISGLIYDVTAVALPLTIGILVVGVILLVVSIVIPSKKKEAEL